jgi:hypothetical protein
MAIPRPKASNSCRVVALAGSRIPRLGCSIPGSSQPSLRAPSPHQNPRIGHRPQNTNQQPIGNLRLALPLRAGRRDHLRRNSKRNRGMRPTAHPQANAPRSNQQGRDPAEVTSPLHPDKSRRSASRVKSSSDGSSCGSGNPQPAFFALIVLRLLSPGALTDWAHVGFHRA